ncbi:MAG: hypothetical protein ABW189_04815 [Rickettsiales bacterium]
MATALTEDEQKYWKDSFPASRHDEFKQIVFVAKAIVTFLKTQGGAYSNVCFKVDKWSYPNYLPENFTTGLMLKITTKTPGDFLPPYSVLRIISPYFGAAFAISDKNQYTRPEISAESFDQMKDKFALVFMNKRMHQDLVSKEFSYCITKCNDDKFPNI